MKKQDEFTERVSIGSYLVFNIPLLFFLCLFSAVMIKRSESDAEYLVATFAMLILVSNLLTFGQKLTVTKDKISHRDSFFRVTTIDLKKDNPTIDVFRPPSTNGMSPLPKIRITGGGKEISLNPKAFSMGLFSRLKDHIKKNSRSET